MALNNPFTLYLEIRPFTTVRADSTQVPKKRFEGIRELQRIATEMYSALVNNSTITLAEPGGGQEKRIDDLSKKSFSSLSEGLAVKPGFGEGPAIATITGFHRPTASSAAYNPYNEKMIFCAGATVTGPSNTLKTGAPTAQMSTDLAELIASVKSEFSALPSNVEYSIFKVEYCGVAFGHTGIHLP